MAAHGRSLDYRTAKSCRWDPSPSTELYADELTRQLGSERFLAPEILFNPELIGQEYPGVHQVIVDSIGRADLDLRKALFGNIVLSGGSTLCTGQPENDKSFSRS
jgi:actin-related protein